MNTAILYTTRLGRGAVFEQRRLRPLHQPVRDAMIQYVLALRRAPVHNLQRHSAQAKPGMHQTPDHAQPALERVSAEQRGAP
jgi:hypothetical protein